MSQTAESVIQSAVSSIMVDLKVGIAPQDVAAYWAKKLTHLLAEKQTEARDEPALRVPATGASSNDVLHAGVLPEVKSKPAKPVKSKTTKEDASVNKMSVRQLVKELYKLSEKFSYYSLGKVLGIDSAAYATMRAWCTKEYLPSSANQKKIRKLLLDIRNKDVKVLAQLKPVGRRPKGGFSGTQRNKK